MKAVDSAAIFMKTSIRQVENVTVQKLRRTYGVASLYSRIYEQERLLELLLAMARRFRGQSKKLLLGGAVMSQAPSSNFDWSKHVISASELNEYYGEIDFCQSLREKTMTCGDCGQRNRIDCEVQNVSYCRCPNSPKSVYDVTVEGVSWKPFIERRDLLVWRMEHPQNRGNYMYKMYGKFHDVSLDEFLSVQLDTSSFRRSWDTNTNECKVIDTKKDDGSVVYYWDVKWPSFFANRDYCCHRQHVVDPDSGMVVVVSKSTEHPDCPSNRKSWRVKDYWSIMTIKPVSSPDQLGVEFCLTGYENPGVRLPESIVTWVAIRGMPEFMENLRTACLKMRKEKMDKMEKKVSDWGMDTAAGCSKQARKLDGHGYSLSQNHSTYA